jgi:stage II sporulation protein D
MVIFAALALAISFLQARHLQAQTVYQDIRVLLSRDSGRGSLSGHDVVVDGRTFVRVKIQRRNGRFSVSGLAPSGESLIFSSSTKELDVRARTLRYNDSVVPPRIRLIATGGLRATGSSSDHFLVITNLPLTEYLESVLPSEMPSSWPLEALKAQAVASRSYALSMMQSRRHEIYDVEGTYMNQVFDFQRRQSLRGRSLRNIVTAVASTQTEVLVNRQRSTIYRSHFHADCGGQTETAVNVWTDPMTSKAFPSTSVQDPHCGLRGQSAWAYETSMTEFVSALSREPAVSEELAQKLSLEREHLHFRLGERTPSGRAKDLEVLYDQSQSSPLMRWTTNRVRALVGFEKIKSAHFELEQKPNSVVFRGRGFGHGVGLCQQGARWRAQAGQSYREILRRYYPEADLQSTTTRALQLLQAKSIDTGVQRL